MGVLDSWVRKIQKLKLLLEDLDERQRSNKELF